MANQYTVGDRVHLLTIDKFGFNGREFHPTAEDLKADFTGIVVAVHREEEAYGEDPIPPEDEIFCYRVCRPSDGRMLELMEHELELLPS